MDAGRKEDATGIVNATATFTKTNVPYLYKDVIALQVKSQLLFLDHPCVRMITTTD